jgi:hypothetical protein
MVQAGVAPAKWRLDGHAPSPPVAGPAKTPPWLPGRSNGAGTPPPRAQNPATASKAGSWRLGRLSPAPQCAPCLKRTSRVSRAWSVTEAVSGRKHQAALLFRATPGPRDRLQRQSSPSHWQALAGLSAAAGHGDAVLARPSRGWEPLLRPAQSEGASSSRYPVSPPRRSSSSRRAAVGGSVTREFPSPRATYGGLPSVNRTMT